MKAHWLGAALVASTIAVAHAQSYPFPYLMNGEVRGVDRVGRDVSLHIHFRYPDRDQVLLVAPPKVPPAYAGLVEPSWQQPCEFKPGNSVSVSELAGEAVTVQYQAAPPQPPDSRSEPSAQPWQLCYVRLYFDLDQPQTEYAIGLSSGLIVHYASPLHLWIRGSADKSLRPYADPALMEQLSARFGQPHLASSARTLANFRTKSGTATILVKALPFHYPERDHPVGGGWNQFAITVYTDHGARNPTRRLDFSAHELPQAPSQPKVASSSSAR
jgi:hypothetical protein